MKRFGVVSFIVLLLAGCSFPQAKIIPTEDLDAMVRAKAATVFAHYTETSAALQPTLTQTASQVPPTILPSATATNAPIPEPVSAVASSNVTVRDEPRKGSKNVGGIFFNQAILVIARNDSNSWYYIQWPQSATGTAWVLAAAVDMKQNDPTHLPIALIASDGRVTVLPPLTWAISGTPLPINGPAAGAQTAVVKQLAQVRVGPGSGYSSMGMINIGITVVITGRTDQNTWLQIEYPSGPGGHGWLSGELVEMKGTFAGLPYYNLLATPVSDPDLAAAKIGEATPEENRPHEATATPEPTPTSSITGEVTAFELNVRSGPASMFTSLGLLHHGDTIVITGITINRLWYRITYAAAPDGYGYVSPKYINITGGDMRTLKTLNDKGTPTP